VRSHDLIRDVASTACWLLPTTTDPIRPPVSSASVAVHSCLLSCLACSHAPETAHPSPQRVRAPAACPDPIGPPELLCQLMPCLRQRQIRPASMPRQHLLAWCHPLSAETLSVAPPILLLQPTAPLGFAGRLGPMPVAAAVVPIASGTSLQRGRQLQEGWMPFAQPIPPPAARSARSCCKGHGTPCAPRRPSGWRGYSGAWPAPYA
jgi:hypothetical protein